MKILAKNKKALAEYEILETLEAGIQLYGCEVKSVKKGRISLSGAFVIIQGGEAYLLNAYIPPYQPKNIPERVLKEMGGKYDPERKRKLLLKKEEILNLFGKMKQKHLTIIPLKVYTKNAKIKVEIALARKKRKFEKKQKLKEKVIEREIEKELKEIEKGI